MSLLSLYFHIPFCTRKCPYCHFYVIPNRPDHREILLKTLLIELRSLLPKIQDRTIVSIYFGGGTPSLFGHLPIDTLLSTIAKEARIAPECEITLEANPEEITHSLMEGYRRVGINRISIGVQSLVDSSLQVLERTHTAQRARAAIDETFGAGIDNISIDLMYELPDQTTASFQQTLDQLEQLPITHLSLYNLTIEPHTPFSKRKLRLPGEEEGLAMLQAATHHLESIGLERYEISAFAKKGHTSKHNTGYWTARPFFGLGPSAYSYFKGSRFRNVANLKRYADALSRGESPIDFSETLPYPRNVHERLAIQLRLLQGVDLKAFHLPQKTHQTLDQLIAQGLLSKRGGWLKLTKRGLLFYDTVATEIL